MSSVIERSYKYFEAHAKELLAQYRGKFIVVHEEEVHGPFETTTDALSFASSRYDVGTYIVQFVTEEDQTIQRFHSRVAV